MSFLSFSVYFLISAKPPSSKFSTDNVIEGDFASMAAMLPRFESGVMLKFCTSRCAEAAAAAIKTSRKEALNWPFEPKKNPDKFQLQKRLKYWRMRGVL